MLDSPIYGVSFRPIPMVVGALMLKRWIVQNGASEMTGSERDVLGDPPFQYEGTYDHGDRTK